MKSLIALAIVTASLPAIAADAPPKVPTGTDVPGCTFYRLDLN